MSQRRKLGRSMCMTDILQCLKSEKLIELQLVDDRRFYKLAQGIIRYVTIFRCKGIRVDEREPKASELLKSK